MQKQFMGVAALGAALAIADTSHAQAVQWRTQDGGNGHWYQLIKLSAQATVRIPWGEAKLRAEASGGHLATLNVADESGFIWNNFNSQFTVNGVGSPWCCWLGGYRVTGQTFAWVTGEPYSCDVMCGIQVGSQCEGGSENALYTGWNATGPRSCVDFHGDSFQGGKPFYLIEFDADCNNDGIVDYGQCRDGSLPDYNGNNVPDCCEAGATCPIGRYPVQWRLSEGGNGHWYMFATPTGAGMSWQDAKTWASNKGGYLASVTTLAESTWCRSIVSDMAGWWLPHTNPSSYVGPWLGGYQDRNAPDYAEPAGGWRWVSGEPWAWPDWIYGQPDDGCGGEDFLHVLTIGGTFPTMTLNDFNGLCGWMPKSLLVEWSADCNNDGIVDYGQILQGQLPDSNANGIPDACEPPTCRNADLFRDSNVNGVDLGILLAQWGPPTEFTVADLNRDGMVDGIDLGLLLAFWGPCPG